MPGDTWLEPDIVNFWLGVGYFCVLMNLHQKCSKVTGKLLGSFESHVYSLVEGSGAGLSPEVIMPQYWSKAFLSAPPTALGPGKLFCLADISNLSDASSLASNSVLTYMHWLLLGAQESPCGSVGFSLWVFAPCRCSSQQTIVSSISMDPQWVPWALCSSPPHGPAWKFSRQQAVQS